MLCFFTLPSFEKFKTRQGKKTKQAGMEVVADSLSFFTLPSFGKSKTRLGKKRRTEGLLLPSLVLDFPKLPALPVRSKEGGPPYGP